MTIQPKYAKIFKKEPKQICIIIGGIYAGFGTFAYFIMTMQKLMLSNFDSQLDNGFPKLMTTLHEIWGIFMPLMVLLGIAYIGFGLFFNKIKGDRFKINQLISLLSLAWALSYTISSFEFIKLFTTIAPQGLEFIKYIQYASAGFGFAVVIGFFTVPQYLIGKKIKQLETENNKNAI